MAAFSTTRGLPFDPNAAAVVRAAAIEAARLAQKEELRAHGRKLDQEARERRDAERKARREQMRAHGRKLDEEARQRRIEQRKQIDACYVERFTAAD